MISHKHKFIFIHPPRTGGTSIEKALEPYSDDELQILSSYIPRSKPNPAVIYNGADIKHAGLDYFHKLLGNKIYKYTIIVAIRNPWARIISSFIWHEGIGNIDRFDEHIPLYAKGFPPTEPILDYINVPELVSRIRFIDFENLKEDFTEACRDIGLPEITLPHTNETEHDHYSRYYNKYSRELVRSLFKSDIDFFCYEFEDVYKGPRRPEPKPKRHR